ncbi:Hpt domain-containing protein [Herbaspirillum huttiense F1]|uniref:Hpt domain-containing protein n=2 Tax=Herbaspirillum huttiense TaxID=863372 RepID=A0AAJ2H4J8_9BURK|nr:MULTISPECIES: Hpt domain-containing protein [Herbaspirillum]MBP1316220.1 HPt (histidine-containing phosphotransfer) domain-containing protein [Herbaspirillum sp. 1130]MCO4857019.1 Hpt domain-containing protein [Herbaspirillum sp. WGmk3]MDR6742388.1 HPt (histidine-containing phosphotransfer) domain-containing protein [Herbaspirillum sp. 1173]MDR9834104.1 Hpt domain-containing protein [Herbaspirillum huttiense]MDT0355451.1 Hpt domain-containing protein [Herbaspirillum huttiense F1]
MNDHRYQHINPEPLLDAMGGDAAACRHMFGTFAQSAPATFDRLAQAIRADDAAQVKREAHSLKSMTALVGAGVLTELLKSVETQSRAEPPQSAQPQLPELQSLFTAVAAEVRHYVDQVGVAQ